MMFIGGHLHGQAVTCTDYTFVSKGVYYQRRLGHMVIFGMTDENATILIKEMTCLPM